MKKLDKARACSSMFQTLPHCQKHLLSCTLQHYLHAFVMLPTKGYSLKCLWKHFLQQSTRAYCISVCFRPECLTLGFSVQICLLVQDGESATMPSDALGAYYLQYTPSSPLPIRLIWCPGGGSSRDEEQVGGWSNLACSFSFQKSTDFV